MELNIHELRLLRRALRYSVAHLHIVCGEAYFDGRIHEGAAARLEAEQLSNLSEKLHDQLIQQLKIKSLAEYIGTKGHTAGYPERRATGCGAECTNLCATGSCPNRGPSDAAKRGSVGHGHNGCKYADNA